MPYQMRVPARAAFSGDLNPACGGPCGQRNARMPPRVSQDTTESLWDPTLGSLRHPGDAKIKKNAKFDRSGVPEKTQVPRTPESPKNAKKTKFRRNEAVSSKLFFLDPPPNVLRLTREQIFFRFWIDGPEIWPG